VLKARQTLFAMGLRKVINKRIRHASKGINVAGDVNAVIAANTDPGTSSHVSSKQRTRIVQRGGRTEVAHDEATHHDDEGG
jgi:hypothetical protein